MKVHHSGMRNASPAVTASSVVQMKTTVRREKPRRAGMAVAVMSVLRSQESELHGDDRDGDQHEDDDFRLGLVDVTEGVRAGVQVVHEQVGRSVGSALG